MGLKMTQVAIVITTINGPTGPIQAFANMQNKQLFVVADEKTPFPWSLENVHLIQAKSKSDIQSQTSRLLPVNHYSRKNLGYLEAARSGAEIIIDTDDDNFPLDNFGFPDFNGRYLSTQNFDGWLNAYEYFTDSKIWPRGLPLSLINTKTKQPLIRLEQNVGVWQGLANGDPDVDAVYRLTNEGVFSFREHEEVVLSPGTVCPFNSQNTAFRKELFPLLYIPSTVSFRFSDILRSLVAQPIMWLAGFSLGFTRATVFQDRNPHDFFLDFKDEIEMYFNVQECLECAHEFSSPELSVENNLISVYRELERRKIVRPEELLILKSWLEELKLVSGV